MALYVAGYTLGRGWIEYIRIDDVQMDDVFGLRLNVWTSIVLFVLSVAYFIWSSMRRPGREESVFLDSAAQSVDGPVDGPPVSPAEAPVDRAPAASKYQHRSTTRQDERPDRWASPSETQ